MLVSNYSVIKREKIKGKEGFSLIELLIAITILVVVIAVMVSLFAGNEGSKTAQAEKIIDNGRQIAQAVRVYYAKHNKLPSNLGQLLTDGELNSIPSDDWEIVPHNYTGSDLTSPVSLFNDSGKIDDVIIYKGEINDAICEEIIKKSNYVRTASIENESGTVNMLTGMYAIIDKAAPENVVKGSNMDDSITVSGVSYITNCSDLSKDERVFVYLVNSDVVVSTPAE